MVQNPRCKKNSFKQGENFIISKQGKAKKIGDKQRDKVKQYMPLSQSDVTDNIPVCCIYVYVGGKMLR